MHPYLKSIYKAFTSIYQAYIKPIYVKPIYKPIYNNISILSIKLVHPYVFISAFISVSSLCINPK